MKHLILILGGLFVMTAAQATSLSLTPVNDGLGTVGNPALFAVYSGSFNMDASGKTSIELVFNYGNANLAGYSYAGVNLNVGDLLLQSGGDLYGIAIQSHSGAPDGGNASLFASVVKGNVYETTSYLTTNTVLNHPHADYRSGTNVWLGGTVTDLGSLTETISRKAGTNTYTVDLTGYLSQSLVAEIMSKGVSIEFGSATCANGYLTGSAAASVPEPMTMGLMGSGLIAFGLFGRRKMKPGKQ